MDDGITCQGCGKKYFPKGEWQHSRCGIDLRTGKLAEPAPERLSATGSDIVESGPQRAVGHKQADNDRTEREVQSSKQKLGKESQPEKEDGGLDVEPKSGMGMVSKDESKDRKQRWARKDYNAYQKDLMRKRRQK